MHALYIPVGSKTVSHNRWKVEEYELTYVQKQTPQQSLQYKKTVQVSTPYLIVRKYILLLYIYIYLYDLQFLGIIGVRLLLVLLSFPFGRKNKIIYTSINIILLRMFYLNYVHMYSYIYMIYVYTYIVWIK